MPKALIVRTAGTNCDRELARAFALAGATPEPVHIDTLVAEPRRLEDADIIAFPGGFSYGDDIASGRILAMRAREGLWPALASAAAAGVPIGGICNGFQVLVQAGLLPGPIGPERPAQTVSLAHNASGRFVDRWVRVEADGRSPCVWTRGFAGDLEGADREAAAMLPIAHGEGRVVAEDAVLDRLASAGQIALTYTEDVNGSARRIAGLCDPTGRVFGLMPHPERYLEWTRHPFWTRLAPGVRRAETPGLRVFRNAVEAVSRVEI